MRTTFGGSSASELRLEYFEKDEILKQNTKLPLYASEQDYPPLPTTFKRLLLSFFIFMQFFLLYYLPMNIKKLAIITSAILLFIQPNTFAIEDSDLFNPVEVKDGSILSVVDCVATAFQNSPKIRRRKYELDIAKSNVGIARSRYFPVIGAGVGFYNENNSDNSYYYSHYRELPNIGVTINKLVWDFGKTTAYIKMEEFYKIGAEYEFVDSLCSTVFDVKDKYYKYLEAKALLNIAEDDVKINEIFVKESKNKADLTTAKVNLSDAKARYLKALNECENARTDLSNSMYLEDQPEYDIKNTGTFSYNNPFSYFSETEEPDTFKPETFKFPIKDAVGIAYENSPDLNVLISTKDAMVQSLKYIQKTYLPELSANAGYGLNSSTQTTNNSFQVGVNLSSSVNLMELKHSIKGGEAQVNIADNEILLFKKDLFFEVKRALNNADKTAKQIPIAQLEASQGLENLKTVESQYKSGELNYVALQNARKDYINALQRYVESLFNYNMSLIQVEMAMHYHIVDIHHKSEHAMRYHSEELIQHLNKVLGCDEKELHKIKLKYPKQDL